MLVWINGPFGVGKTATASLRGNFQDIRAWRHSVRAWLRRYGTTVRSIRWNLAPWAG